MPTETLAEPVEENISSTEIPKAELDLHFAITEAFKGLDYEQKQTLRPELHKKLLDQLMTGITSNNPEALNTLRNTLSAFIDKLIVENM